VISDTEPDWEPVRRYAPGVDGGRAACALGATGLLVCLFALRWFGAVGPSQGLERTGRQLALGGWQTLTATRWVLIALCAAGLLAGLAGQRAIRSRPELSALLAALAGAATVLVGYQILIDPPQPARIVDVKLGGYVALLCAAAIAAGAAGAWRGARDARAALHP
jgi:hypothetical protein